MAIQLSQNLGENECGDGFICGFLFPVQSHQCCVLINLSVRRRIGKNWLRSAMTIISSDTLVYN
jgi:hypothetical protein